MKYKISTDEKDRINLGSPNNDGKNTITIGSTTFQLSGNSILELNGMKIVSKNGRIYVNGKLFEQEGAEKRYAYRIIALEDIRDNTGKIIVRAGEKGGYVESEENLSQEGSCWIFNNAVVTDNARVLGSAQIRNNASVGGSAVVCDNAIISDEAQINDAHISGNAKVYGNAEVYDNATVTDNAKVYGYAEVYDNAEISGKAKVYGDAEVYDNAMVTDNAEVCGDAEVYDNAEISGNAKVCDDAEVYDGAKITDEVKVCKDAEVFGNTTLTGRQCIRKSIVPENSDSDYVSDNITINGVSLSIGGSSSTSKSKHNNMKFKTEPINKGEMGQYKAKNPSQFLDDFERDL